MKPKSNPEVKVCGLNAVRALFERRPADIIRVYVTEPRIRDVGPLLRWCAENKKAYHVVDPEEIARVAETVHHEDLCVLARQKPTLGLDALVRARPSVLVLLENVRNPHNFGAVLRVCAHFGVSAVVVPSLPGKGGISTSVYRTAEGGAESVEVAEVGPLPGALQALRGIGLAVIGTSGRGRTSLYASRLPERFVLLLGAESEGLSRELLAACDEVLAIPGTGAVESLNVSCAATAFLGEAWRQRVR